MSVQIAKAAIREFLASDSQKVMSLKGGWGVGKTYAWKEALKAESQNTKMREFLSIRMFRFLVLRH
jgi:hypothetical protein